MRGRPTRPSVRALLALLVASAALVATSYAAPTISAERAIDVEFEAGDRTIVRRVRIELVASDREPDVAAWVTITSSLADAQSISLRIRRDSDSVDVFERYKPDPAISQREVGDFDPFEACGAGDTCAEDFTVTFERSGDDLPLVKASFQFSVRASYMDPNGGAPPPEARIAVTVTD